MLSLADVKVALKSAVDECGLGAGFRLKEAQLNLLLHFLNRNDCLGVLPTNFGKSIIFQLAPVVAKVLFESGHSSFTHHPVVFVVTPINALVDDQVQSCLEMGIAAQKLCSEHIEEIKLGKLQLIYTSPEYLLSEQYRETLLSVYQERVLGIVVDEAHLVVKWGTSTQKDQSAFRSLYSQIGNLRAYFKRPFLCLTATANKLTRQSIIKILQLKNTKIEKLSPEKTNVKLFINRVKNENDIVLILNSLLTQIKNTGVCDKTVIYCSSLKACGELYITLKQELGEIFPVGMFHSKTPDEIKTAILDDFSLQNNIIYHIVIATSALGIGVNIPNIRKVLHFGLSSDIESYVQEIGRAGRDSLNSEAILCYKPTDLAHCNDESMKLYCKNKTECRRQLLLSFFKEVANPFHILHDCCDICQIQCKCDACSQPSDIAEPSLQPVRTVTAEQKATFGSCLNSRNLSVTSKKVFDFSGSLILNKSQINGLGLNLDKIDSRKCLFDLFGIPEVVAVDVLVIINEIFGDIKQEELQLVSNDDCSFLPEDFLSLSVEKQNKEQPEDEFYWQEEIDHL